MPAARPAKGELYYVVTAPTSMHTAAAARCRAAAVESRRLARGDGALKRPRLTIRYINGTY